MRKFLLFLLVSILLISSISIQAKEAPISTSDDTSSKIIIPNKKPISPLYTRSYWWYGLYRVDKGDVVFYTDSDGYRGYISRQSKLASDVFGGIALSYYAGTLYHPSVKNIPAPSSITNPPSTTLENQQLAKVNSKYVTIQRTYPYDIVKHGFYFHRIVPLQFFYNDGVYKGYLSHTKDLPVDIKEYSITLTYGGTVYSGGNYPAPSNHIQKETH